MFSVYVLKMSHGKYYIGQTRNLKLRLVRHSTGQVRSTRLHLPVQLVYVEEYTSRSESMIREKQLKSWKSHTAIDKLIANNMASSSNG